MTYSSPAASLETAEAAYREASFEAAAESMYAARTYAGYLKRRVVGRGAALDIGCGDGAFLRELVALGFDPVSGIEPSRAPVEAAPADVRPRIRQEMFGATRFAAESFDLVTCFQTIEHVYEPRRVVEEIARILKPGGAAFLVAHDVDALSARVLGARSPIFDIEHLQLLNRHSARILMERAGFSDVQIFPISNTYPLAYWWKLLPVPARPKSWLLRSLQSGALQWLGRVTASLPAGNIGILGTK